MSNNDNNFLIIYKNDIKNEIKDPAYKFPFELDLFQNEANYRISINENVFVTAHTGCGKTVVALYAIANCLKNNKKVIYTSPTKSLSNQKFKEFSEKFPDVGILTGDIKMNPEAQCVIMTTEILLNILYKENNHQSIKIDEIGAVIFDEVHYINDKDRGKVWEETIVLLPKEINLVLLSATIDKPEKMAGWIGKIKKKKISLITTHKRVVPLRHFFWDEYEEELVEIVNEKGVLINYNEIKSNYVTYKYNSIINNFVDYLQNKKLLPAIYFKFSRKKCEYCAKQIQKSLISHEDSRKIEIIFNNKMAPFKKNYEHLKQYSDVFQQLKKGVVYHHSGLIPILKEIIEILYAEGLIKLLFATETFAVGVNMPAKTVIFNELEKYDNNGLRDLRTDEYLQMSGRAGRRGLDRTGTVIILPTMKLPNYSVLKSIMTGKSPGINSKFIPSYQFILKSLHNNNLNVNDFVKTTLSSDENDLIIENEKKKLIQLKEKHNNPEYSEIDIEIKNLFDEYYEKKKKTENQYIKLPKKIQKKYKKRLREIENSDSYKNNLSIIEKEYKFTSEVNKIETNINFHLEFLNYDIESILNILYENYYIDDNYKLSDKGLITIEINDCNPIIFTELIYNKYFENLSVEEIVGIIACFIDVKIMNNSISSIKDLKIPIETKKILYDISDLNHDYHNIEDKKYNIITDANYNLYLDFIEPAYIWVSGGTINQILEKFEIYEGNFVRGILRINSVCEDLIKISEIIKDYNLLKKLEGIEEKLIRDIVTINSLYIN